MRTISDHELAVFISLLANKIADMRRELALLEALDADDFSDEQIEDHTQLHEIIEQYTLILDGLEAEYEAARQECLNLRSFEELTAALRS
jgi:hypothetical protein